MFCLRSWLAILIFMTNCPPFYILLYVVGFYCLSRPCVYCTLLLTVLIVSLFDFSGDWFAPRWPGDHISITETIGSALSGNATVTEVLGQTAGAVMSAMNSSGAVLEGVKRKIGMGSSEVAAGGDSFEWLRILAEKKAFRIPCVDVMVRL